MSSPKKSLELRATFGEVPEQYDRARPTYPEELLDDLVELAAIPPRGRVLELGPGPGKATVPLAERGFQITGIELSDALAEIARRKLAPFPNAQIVVEEFETWQPPAEPFDAVVAFTAFHWIEAAVRFSKTAAVLRDTGSLAVVGTHHVRVPGGDEFWVDVQSDYDTFDPDPNNAPPPFPDDVHDLRDELAASDFFGPVAERRYLDEITYNADEYIDLLGTYSAHRAIEPARRQRLDDAIHRRIEAQPGGTVTKTYLWVLDVARKGSTGAELRTTVRT